VWRRIAAIADSGTEVRITLAGGRDIVADLTVIDRRGAVTGLTGKRGLRSTTSPSMRACTSDPHPRRRRLLLVSTCRLWRRAVRLEAWRNAQEQGALAAGTCWEQAEIRGRAWFWVGSCSLTAHDCRPVGRRAQHMRRDLGDGACILFIWPRTAGWSRRAYRPQQRRPCDIKAGEMLIGEAGKGARSAHAFKLKSLLAA
jgi:3-phenylpropionate/trans-cinnamate dioxygenase ferredoxin reductase subunit